MERTWIIQRGRAPGMRHADSRPWRVLRGSSGSGRFEEGRIVRRAPRKRKHPDRSGGPGVVT